MAITSLSGLVQVGLDVLSTVLTGKKKTILANLGSIKGAKPDVDNVDWWQHVGIASRPSEPDSGSEEAAQVIVLRGGSRDVAIASRDVRANAIYGALAPGETCIYAAGADGTAQARILLKADGGIHLYTVEGNEDGGGSMGITVHPDGYINLTAPNGNAVLIGDDGSIKIFNASGGIQVKADGSIKVAGSTQLALSAGSVAIGGPSALPIAIGPNTVTAISALQTQIAALQTEIAAIQTQCATSFAAIVAVPPVTAAAPVVTPAVAAATAAVVVAVTAVGTGTAAVSAASAIIPSLRTSSD